MKKFLSLMLTLALVGLTLAGCGNPGNETQMGQTTTPAMSSSGGSGTDPGGSTDQGQATSPLTAEETDPPATWPGTSSENGGTLTPPEEEQSAVSLLYTNFYTQKATMLSRINDGLSQHEETSFYSFGLLGVMLIDLGLIPISFFGYGEEMIHSGLGYLGADDLEYTENGNTYRVSYKDSEGKTLVIETVYNPMANAMLTTLTHEGEEVMVSEIHETSYGYVGWYNVFGDDEEPFIYLVTVRGEDGAVGLQQPAERPPTLNGNEPFDYPTSAEEWYLIEGNRITGTSSDGTAFDITFTPTTEEVFE